MRGAERIPDDQVLALDMFVLFTPFRQPLPIFRVEVIPAGVVLSLTPLGGPERVVHKPGHCAGGIGGPRNCKWQSVRVDHVTGKVAKVPGALAVDHLPKSPLGPRTASDLF